MERGRRVRVVIVAVLGVAAVGGMLLGTFAVLLGAGIQELVKPQGSRTSKRGAEVSPVPMVRIGRPTPSGREEAEPAPAEEPVPSFTEAQRILDHLEEFNRACGEVLEALACTDRLCSFQFLSPPKGPPGLVGVARFCWNHPRLCGSVTVAHLSYAVIPMDYDLEEDGPPNPLGFRCLDAFMFVMDHHVNSVASGGQVCMVVRAPGVEPDAEMTSNAGPLCHLWMGGAPVEAAE